MLKSRNYPRLCILCSCFFLLLPRLYAQPVVQLFYLPYPENQVFNALTTIFPGDVWCGFPSGSVPTPSSPIRTYISISPYLASTVIYYDHWEDGYETEITRPTQASTQIWGDNNPANGIPPGFSTDIISAGASVILQNNINPSNLALIDFDARDKIGTSRPVTITKSHWATGSETLLAGTLLTNPVANWGTTFVIPVGENVNTNVQSFSYTGFSVMAKDDGTLVSYDGNADGVFEGNVTINEGESFHINGRVLRGARIQATKPIQVHLTTGDRCDNYESRWFNIPPLADWGNNYVGPLSGLDKLYLLYNPGTSSITVRVVSRNGNLGNLTIAPNNTATVQGIANAGLRFITLDGSPFAALALSDAASTIYYENRAWDWGSMLLPVTELTQQVVLGWAPGQDPNFPITENTSPLWLTVSRLGLDNFGQSTRVCVDYNGDNIGPLTDTYGRNYDVQLNVTNLEAVKILDPDGDQTNMLAYVCDGTNGIISAVWGEDAATATPGSPGLDLGNSVPSIFPFYASKTGNLFTDVNGNGLYNIGDVVQFQISIINNALVPISGPFNVGDVLPQWVTYVNNSTQLTQPGGAVSAIADAGATTFPLDESGANVSVTLNPNQTALVTFRATINARPPGDGCMTNIASVSRFGIVYRPEWSFCVIVQPEICGNGIDDDQDGASDCNDPDCFATNAMGGQFCLGATINLTASGGNSYNWSGPSSFSSTAQNPSRTNANFAMSGTYSVTISNGTCTTVRTVQVNVANCSFTPVSCEALSCAGSNLLTSGNFESFSSGSPGFSTDLNYVNCGTAGSGFYSVVDNARNCNSIWLNAPDHTLSNGNGRYLVANYATPSPGLNLNGNAISGEIVQFSSVPVLANEEYCFSAWFLKLCSSCAGEPDVTFMVNGISVGTSTGASIAANGWTKKGFTFNTADFGNPSTLTLSIVQNSFGTNGFDLGIDDVELRLAQAGTVPTLQNDLATVCNANPLTINVLSNDAGYLASTLSVAAQPPADAGTVTKSGNNLVFTPIPGFSGQVSFSYSVCGAADGCCAVAVVTVNVAPVTAIANGESPVCTGTTLSISATGGTNYAWTGPNGFTASSSYATIAGATLAASGTYSVTVSNSFGCSATATVPITVQTCITNRDPECNCN